MPKIVFSGTAMIAIVNVTWNAWIVSCAIRASHALVTPSLPIRQKIIDSGPTRIISKYMNATARSVSLRLSTFVPRGEPTHAADSEQYSERDREQHDGDRRSSRRVATLVAEEDVHR